MAVRHEQRGDGGIPLEEGIRRTRPFGVLSSWSSWSVLSRKWWVLAHIFLKVSLLPSKDYVVREPFTKSQGGRMVTGTSVIATEMERRDKCEASLTHRRLDVGSGKL